ncbi:MAG: hypothetical protein ACYC3H_11380 [Bellilinea sp.]
MENSKLPPFKPFLAVALILGGFGILGLALLFGFTLPTLGPRWLFFFFGAASASGLALPVIYFLHWRFPSPSPVTPGIIVRQAMWVGIYFDLLAWFQLGRVLSLPLAVGLATGLGVIEFALRIAERSRFAPGDSNNG